MHVAQPTEPRPVACAMVEAANLIGVPRFDSPNGEMMESGGGVAIADLRIKSRKRESVYSSYTYPRMHQPNLTVLTDATVWRLVLDGNKVVGVQAVIGDKLIQVDARCEVVLPLGAINTPKVLMQSDIGPQDELRAHGIKLVQHLPGWGKTTRTMSRLGALGNICSRRRWAAEVVRRHCTGRAMLASTHPTSCSANSASLSLRRLRWGSRHLRLAGRCLPAWLNRKAGGGSGSPGPLSAMPC